MADSERVRKLISAWQAAQAADKQPPAGREPARGYDAKYGRHALARERAAEEAHEAASLARKFLGKPKKP